MEFRFDSRRRPGKGSKKGQTRTIGSRVTWHMMAGQQDKQWHMMTEDIIQMKATRGSGIGVPVCETPTYNRSTHKAKKYCPSCMEEKPISEFSKDKNRRGGGISGYCKKCKSDKEKNWVPHSNCQTCNRIIDKSKTYCVGCLQKKEVKRKMMVKRDLKSAVSKYKDELRDAGCSICGYSKCLWALEFHHLFGDKEIAVSKIGTISRLKKEILDNNLVILCANCHRELHAGLINEDKLLDKVLTC
jgi:hypothetical protein